MPQNYVRNNFFYHQGPPISPLRYVTAIFIFCTELDSASQSGSSHNISIKERALTMNQQLCVEQTTLRKFLQASRTTNDNLINDFFSKTKNNQKISNSPPDCKELIKSLNSETLKRTNILKYCDSVYEQLLSQEEQQKGTMSDPTGNENGSSFNGRINPYSEEDYNDKINKNFEISNSMKYWLLNEYQVEQILNSDNLKKLTNNNCFDFSRFMG